ncbi:MAG: dihydrofolate reductase family protein [Saprospiraceae bacterium]
MGKVKLYIATSLDGKIARSDGDVSWLDEVPNPNKEDYDYFAFYDSIGVTLMGNNTYQEILGFDVEFPYKGKTNYVFSRNRALKNDENVSYVNGDITSFVESLKEKEEDIWLVGGGEIVALFLNNNLVDEALIFIMPVLLGEGIPLIGKLQKDLPLKLIKTKTWKSGVIELHYKL